MGNWARLETARNTISKLVGLLAPAVTMRISCRRPVRPKHMTNPNTSKRSSYLIDWSTFCRSWTATGSAIKKGFRFSVRFDYMTLGSPAYHSIAEQQNQRADI